MRLSKAQGRALSKLSDRERCAYDLQESMATLRSLVDKGLAGSRGYYGSLFSPRSNVYFFLTGMGHKMIKKKGEKNGLAEG